MNKIVFRILLLAVIAGGLMSSCTSGNRPNIILIIIDSLRADHLGLYGYAKPTSPVIDRFGQSATVYEHTISQAPHTLPSILQIMTSKYQQGQEVNGEYVTLSEVLHAQDYQTVAVVENATFEQHPTAYGLMRGFDRFYRNGFLNQDLISQLYKTNTSADCITAQAIRWLKTRDRKRPFFLWLHYFDPHDPYLPPFADDMENLAQKRDSSISGDIRSAPYFQSSGEEGQPKASEKDMRHLRELYDAEVRYVDQSIGEFFEFLRSEQLYEPSLVVISADHGESLGEHNIWSHGVSLFDPEIHIPLVIKRPHQHSGVRIYEAAQAIDLFPTILEGAGIPPPKLKLDGQCLSHQRTEPAFAFWNDWEVVRTHDWKLLKTPKKMFLFDLRADPGEAKNVLPDHPDIASLLTALRETKLRSLQLMEKTLHETSSDIARALRSLGYLR